jgi:hypothetical protein
MDLFTRERSAAYVPAFAARLLLSIGKSVATASGDLRRVAEEDAESLWTLCLILVRWYADALPAGEQSLVTALLGDAELQPILRNLGVFRASLLPFVKAAHEAESEPRLAAAGVYFTSAAQQVGVPLLSAAIQSGPVASLRETLPARFPLPPAIRSAYAAVLRGDAAVQSEPTQPSRVAPVPRATRGDRFERAGFERRPRASPSTQRLEARGARSELAASASTPLPAGTSPPPPQLGAADVTRAYLLTLRWRPDEVERLLAGPKRSP